MQSNSKNKIKKFKTPTIKKRKRKEEKRNKTEKKNRREI